MFMVLHYKGVAVVYLSILNEGVIIYQFSSCLSSHQILVWGRTPYKPPDHRRLHEDDPNPSRTPTTELKSP